jgi:hypothetical protein
MGSVKMRLGISRAHLGWANGQPGKKDFAYLFNFFSKPTFGVQCIFF